jgi:hypothetical protein
MKWMNVSFRTTHISSNKRLPDEWLNRKGLEGRECVIFTEGRGTPSKDSQYSDTIRRVKLSTSRIQFQGVTARLNSPLNIRSSLVSFIMKCPRLLASLCLPHINWFCVCSNTGIVGLNSTRGMDVCLYMYLFRQRSCNRLIARSRSLQDSYFQKYFRVGTGRV